MKSSDFISDCGYLLYYKFHEINFELVGSYIDSTPWIKNKKAIINLINKKDNKCCQYALTVTLNHKKSKKTRKE